MVDIIRHPAVPTTTTVDGGTASSRYDDTLDGGNAFTTYPAEPDWYATVGGYEVPLTTTLTTTVGQTVPLMMTEVNVSRVIQHTVHEILGRSDPDVTFGSTQTRSGSLTFLYETIELADAATTMLAAPGAVTLADTAIPSLNMQLVVVDALSLQPDAQDQEMWALTVPFREVLA